LRPGENDLSLQSKPSGAEGTPDRGEYVSQFRRHCHQLIAVGYSRIHAEDHSESEEDFITQRLKETIRGAQREGTLPRWADRYFVTDQAPVSALRRVGKKRPKIDLEFQSTESRNRPVYHFEAKRLRRGNSSPGKYLGRDGLRMFLTELYGLSGNEGGMLGYVQSESPEHWAKKIQGKLERDPKENHRLTDDGKWIAARLTPELKYTYATCHHRLTLGNITIYHTLLDFRIRENQEPNCTAPPVATTGH
jgi:hypothetical protein